MANEQLIKFAQELKAAREEKEISIKDLHQNTRIDTKYLEALEDGNYSILPEVYVRAFIREYAAEVGLDVEETLRKYELAKSGKNFNDAEAEETIPQEEKTETAKSVKTDFGNEQIQTAAQENKKQNNMIIFAASGIILLGIILFLIFSGGSDNEIIIENKYSVPETGKTEQTETIAKTETKTKEVSPEKETQKTEPTTEEITAVIPENPFSLKITGTDTVWVRAKIDENRTEEFMLYPEISRTIEVNGIINLLIGNSAGVELYVDGKKLEFAGEKGKVRNLIVTKDGIKK